jgi:hypothetical protein
MTEERAEYKVEGKAASKQGDMKEVSAEEALRTVVYIQEAIINILEQKGIADRSEIMAEVKLLVQKQQKH